MQMEDSEFMAINDENISRVIGVKKGRAFKGIYLGVKRFFDIILSVIGLIIVLPILAIIAIALKIDSKGPVFFCHTRFGKNGKTFKMYKFRTMVENAEELLRSFDEEKIKEFKENYKLKNDARITKVGNILRKASLDELPQIINILKGDMSIIGPRPIVEEELEKYGDNKNKFLSMKPGLTGYWAANGRSCKTYEERIKMELYYIDNCSFWLDIKIIFNTVVNVIKRKGAI